MDGLTVQTPQSPEVGETNSNRYFSGGGGGSSGEGTTMIDATASPITSSGSAPAPAQPGMNYFTNNNNDCNNYSNINGGGGSDGGSAAKTNGNSFSFFGLLLNNNNNDNNDNNNNTNNFGGTDNGLFDPQNNSFMGYAEDKTAQHAEQSSSLLPRVPSSNSVERIDPKRVDDILSKELMQMSFEQRSNIQEEVHGVRNAMDEAFPVETPDLLTSSLMDLHRHLAEIPLSQKLAWSEAQSLPVTYIRHADFELRFLRCELFDSHKAATRLVQFVDMVKDYFGPVALQRPPRLDDFDAEEIDVMKVGALMQVLPFRDRSGRKILACVGDFGLQNKYRTRCRIYVYMFFVATDDVDTQRNGVVIIIWPGPEDMKLSSPNRMEHVEGNRIFEAVPMRVCSMHFCFRDTPLYRLIKAGLVMMLGEQKTRFRLLVGEDLELRYDIMGYGIPMDLIPITDTGTVKTKNLKDWMKVRKVIEQGIVQPPPIDCPATHDVVFGYGKAFTMHPGNVMYRGLLEEYCEEHRVATTLDAKKKITWRIVEDVEQRGGRFLQWDKRGWWSPFLDRKEIRSKVAVTLKDHTRRVLARQHVTNNSSSTLKFERQDGKKRKRESVGIKDQHKRGIFECEGCEGR
eukprot:CAMPEP_0113454234 /NCGR_PEP_ID=MMETSP0014_2-20120614/7759_1 /TAXON_ID=2857 /ORGANISM="Nitzschia sp." /LENGTH=625 /DNA_ID=CAMNT_0000345635 /DNA_START=20 /DNA_END=1897 /DNA_ORIENTATION=- /assembly_acc=CAM_ASM_000159